MSAAYAPAIVRPTPKPPEAPSVSTASSRNTVPGVPRFLSVGAPLSAEVRAPMEQSFATNLADVRVHTSPAASSTADAAGAKAYAVGNNIVLGSRSSPNDLGLMAHETAHVIQQSQGGARVQAYSMAKDCPLENEAHRASAAVVRAEPYRVSLSTGGAHVQFSFWDTLSGGVGSIIDSAVGYLREHARSIPGYDLLAVAIGRDPLTQRPVDRSAANVIRGLMGLIPGGSEMYDNIARSGVIERAAAWVQSELLRLNLSWERVRTTVGAFLESLSLSDVLNLGGVLKRAVSIFGTLVRDVITFAGSASGKLLEFVFEGALALAGSAGQQVLAILRRAGTVMRQIISDPVGFLRNLMAAVFGGFKQFGANILTHLRNAVFDWLFGAMAGAGIQLPRRFDLQGIVSVALQVLGLTWQNLRLKLVRRLGERVVGGLEQSFEFLRVLVTQGLAAAWQKLLEFATGLTETVIEGIKSWVQTTIVQQALLKLATMANPVGAVIQSIIAIYNTVMFVVERARQLMAFVTSVTDSIANIAAGRIGAAISYVEQSLARILPLVISFLARLIGLGGISAKIQEVIKRVRAPIDRAMDRIVDWVIGKAKTGATKLVSAVRRLLGLAEPFTGEDGTPHQLIIEGSEDNPRPMVHSVIFDIDVAHDRLSADAKKSADKWRKQLKASLAELKKAGITGDAVGNREKKASEEVRTHTRTLREAMRELCSIYARDIFSKGKTGVLPLNELPKPEGPAAATEDGKAKFIKIEKLSANRLNHKGSATENSTYVKSFKFIQAAGLTDDGPRFVKLHLINAKFGGQGKGNVAWKNLVPATSRNNSMHLGSLETVIKRAVGNQDGGGRESPRGVVWYEASVDYHSSAADWTEPVHEAIKKAPLRGKLKPSDFAKKVTFTWGFHDPKLERDGKTRKWKPLPTMGTFVLPVPLPRFVATHLGKLKEAAATTP